jgi:hypothetical protein
MHARDRCVQNKHSVLFTATPDRGEGEQKSYGCPGHAYHAAHVGTLSLTRPPPPPPTPAHMFLASQLARIPPLLS